MEHLIQIYLDYLDNYLTIERYAEHEQIEINDARELIALAKKYYVTFND
jgi:hypothetical protein